MSYTSVFRFHFKCMLLALMLYCSGIAPSYAQSEVDAVRFASKHSAIGARALGMGSAFIAVADDYSALFSNPSGLGLLKKQEVQLGFQNLSFNSESSYLSDLTESDLSKTSMDMLGIAIPFPTLQGSFTLAFGYSRSADFESVQQIKAFNINGSINDYFVSAFSPVFDEEDPTKVLLLDPGALAFDTYLQDISSDGKEYENPQVSNGQIEQRSDLKESGGINMYSIAASVEIAEHVFLGGAFNYYSGEYSYYRVFEEEDTENIYTTFQYLALEDRITTDIAGFNFKLGLLYNIDDAFTFGITVDSPIYYDLQDTYTTRLSASYDQAPDGTTDETEFQSQLTGDFNYELVAPFRFGIGLSYRNAWLRLSGQAEWVDWSQMEYSDDENQLDQVNRIIETELQQAVAYAAGLEITLPGSNIFFRGGYRYEQSPYKYTLSNPDKSTGYDEAYKTLSLGLGLVLKSSLALDITYQQTSNRFENRLYSSSPLVSDEITLSSLSLTGRFWF